MNIIKLIIGTRWGVRLNNIISATFFVFINVSYLYVSTVLSIRQFYICCISEIHSSYVGVISNAQYTVWVHVKSICTYSMNLIRLKILSCQNYVVHLLHKFVNSSVTNL